MTYSLCCNLLTFFPLAPKLLLAGLYMMMSAFSMFFCYSTPWIPDDALSACMACGCWSCKKKKWVFLGNCGRGQINPKGLGQVNHASTNTRVGLGYSLIQSQEVAHFERWAHRRRVLVIRPTISSLTFILAFYTDTPLMFHYTSKQSHGKLFTICIV